MILDFNVDNVLYNRTVEFFINKVLELLAIQAIVCEELYLRSLLLYYLLSFSYRESLS
jgi:hypothetical protein